MPTQPSFQTLATGAAVTGIIYTQLALIPGSTAGSTIVVTNSAGQTLTLLGPTVLGAKGGAYSDWGPVSIQAFVSNGQYSLNSDIQFGF